MGSHRLNSHIIGSFQSPDECEPSGTCRWPPVFSRCPLNARPRPVCPLMACSSIRDEKGASNDFRKSAYSRKGTGDLFPGDALLSVMPIPRLKA